ncbi:hypothetical protein PVK06_023880 [Gossypium arboreum]|uniref:Aminotransferase-like plant mobile domain-containing protein n=1 Tax=Gossypium arboreum TaxID=29729 RepID=A0ABR0PCL8_GOSAR|nr:hypothetical protein PVK06_023880 [Gossypium arboreum]
MYCMPGACKLDCILISVFVKRWRSETYTFHLPHGECTIRLEDVALQLGLSIDGLVITRSTVIPVKGDLYEALLGKVPNKFQGGTIGRVTGDYQRNSKISS